MTSPKLKCPMTLADMKEIIRYAKTGKSLVGLMAESDIEGLLVAMCRYELERRGGE